MACLTKENGLTESSTKTPDPMDIALGAAVRIRRRTISMSQEALAEQCGVSFQQIQKYENGANRISFSRLVQIARALRCRVTDLLDVLETCVAPNRVMEFMRPMLAGGEGFRIPGGGTALLRKDLAAVKALGADAGMAVPVANRLEALFADAMAAGGGDADLFGLWQLFDQQVLGN